MYNMRGTIKEAPKVAKLPAKISGRTNLDYSDIIFDHLTINILKGFFLYNSNSAIWEILNFAKRLGNSVFLQFYKF